MSVSQNYRSMLDDLFHYTVRQASLLRASGRQSLAGTPKGHDKQYQFCAILEDDLILAPDALIYLQVSDVNVQF
jgi:hypothetical protein